MKGRGGGEGVEMGSGQAGVVGLLVKGYMLGRVDIMSVKRRVQLVPMYVPEGWDERHNTNMDYKEEYLVLK